jgi:chromosome partitioning protein
MALIITVAQQKGGAGKTMVAANLAAHWGATQRVAILDIDPQRSLARWHKLRTAGNRAIRAASLVLIPLQPSPPDLWAAEGTLKLAATERRPVALALNRAPAKSRLRTAIENEIAGRGLNLLPAVLGNRTAYAQAFATGMGVTEGARPGLAGAELAALAAAVLEAANA